jgi:hypothetical protein
MLSNPIFQIYGIAFFLLILTFKFANAILQPRRQERQKIKRLGELGVLTVTNYTKESTG